MPGHCALMGATRLASGIFQQPLDASPLEVAFGTGVRSYVYALADSNNSNIATKEVGTHLRSNLLLLFYLEAIRTNQRKLQGYYCSSLISSPFSPSL